MTNVLGKNCGHEKFPLTSVREIKLVLYISAFPLNAHGLPKVKFFRAFWLRTSQQTWELIRRLKLRALCKGHVLHVIAPSFSHSRLVPCTSFPLQFFHQAVAGSLHTPWET